MSINICDINFKNNVRNFKYKDIKLHAINENLGKKP